MKFPTDYPMNPPSLTILSEFWHPNVYIDGRVCISILHSPGNDPMSGELPEERWMPTQTVSTIMLSFQSMLSDPNCSSPANIDASVMWRDKRVDFYERIKKLVVKANQRVPGYVVIPHPDTDPIEKGKRLDKMKRMDDLNNFSLGGADDSDEIDSEIEDSEDEIEPQESKNSQGTNLEVPKVDCPVCKTRMVLQGKFVKCVDCPIQYSGSKFICGRKCYVLDCGEIRPSGVCDNPISVANDWKCTKNTHKDDENGEENFLEQTMM